ncbi:MAG: TIR domain-containing protein, partial [Pseudonocardiales bacterium]
MARVFVSYASEDVMLACEVHQWLKEAGHTAFLDRDRRDGIPLGKEWKPELRHKLRETDAMVCLVTSRYLTSTCCTDEVRIAQFLGSLLLPLQVEPDVAHPLLTSIQYKNLTEARDHLIVELRGVDARSADRQSDSPGAMSSRSTCGVGVVRRFESRREPVPFGRTSAAARLVDLLHPTTDGPTTIAVTGPPGVGKTALAYYSG